MFSKNDLFIPINQESTQPSILCANTQHKRSMTATIDTLQKCLLQEQDKPRIKRNISFSFSFFFKKSKQVQEKPNLYHLFQHSFKSDRKRLLP